MDWTELEPDDRLTYLIGDIARWDVFLELEAGIVFEIVTKAGTAPDKKPGDLAHLLEAAKDALRAVTLDDIPRAMAREALTEAKVAHGQRVGPVHDYWMHHGGEDERWTRIHTLTTRKPEVPATPHNLTTFVKARDALVRAGWRMRGVGLVLPMWLGTAGPLNDLDESTARLWTMIALGKFKTPEGFGITGVDDGAEAPLPPKRG